MNLVVSPYHLTTREGPAMVALLLADRVVTALPTSTGGRSEAEQLASTAPRYARLIESWRWTVPLWNQGVLWPGFGDDEPGPDIEEAHAEVFASCAWPGLRTLLEQRQHESAGSYLEALAHDLLRGGPDPALSVPVAAGLDRYAARNAAIVMRSAPVSIAQKLEMKRVRTIAGVTVPVLLQGRAERLLEAREILKPQLEDLRSAFNHRFGLDETWQGPPLDQAGAAYRAAFIEQRVALQEFDKSEVRVITGEVSLRAVEMSADAAFESSETATRSLAPRSSIRTPPGLTLAPGTTRSIIVRTIAPH